MRNYVTLKSLSTLEVDDKVYVLNLYLRRFTARVMVLQRKPCALTARPYENGCWPHAFAFDIECHNIALAPSDKDARFMFNSDLIMLTDLSTAKWLVNKLDRLYPKFNARDKSIISAMKTLHEQYLEYIQRG